MLRHKADWISSGTGFVSAPLSKEESQQRVYGGATYRLALPLPLDLEVSLHRRFESERDIASRNPPEQYGERATFEGWLRERLLDLVTGDVMQADMEANHE